MSIPDHDDPAVVPAEYVRTRTFDRVRRGYDPDQVRDYLDRISDRLKWTEKRLVEVEGELDMLRQPGGPYRPFGTFVADMLKAASQQAEEALAAAQRDAEEIRKSAVVEADEIRTQAAREAQQAKNRAATEARQMLEEARLAWARLTGQALQHIDPIRETLVNVHSQFQRLRSGVTEQLQTFADAMRPVEEQIVAAQSTLESHVAQFGQLSMPLSSEDDLQAVDTGTRLPSVEEPSDAPYLAHEAGQPLATQ